MLCSRVAWRRPSTGGSGSEVGICKIKFYIYRVIRNHQLGLESIRIAGMNMGYEHLVGNNELKYLGVKLETRIENSKLLAKNF